MRIITGKYRGRNLVSAEGRTTRPTTAFNREVVFSIYQDFKDKTVLDLFAGTGSFGLEALSRGAIWVDFVEFSSTAIGVLLQNIANLKCADDCHVWRKRVEAFIKAPPRVYDVIFLDPPYDKNLINPVIRQILEIGALAPGGVIIVEHSSREKLDPAFEPITLSRKHGKVTCFTVLKP